MRKRQKIIALIFKTVSSIVGIILSGIIVTGYSTHIGLFDTFEVKIKGNQFVTNAQIQKQLQPFMEESYFSIDLDELQSEISSLDYIECVQLSRILPNTVMVQVIERKPILLITLENQNFLMDKNGSLLPAQGKAISFYPVPIINFSDDMNDKTGFTNDIADVFKFLVNDYPLFYDNLSEVIIGDEKWTFFSDSKTRIFTTSDNLLPQLNVLKNFEKTVYPNKQLRDYSYIDLRVAEQVVVKEKYRKG
ncbi:MAG: FtsQ-type POTRA domain-containing protein [Candidatus Marinimicrobia bacterium]|nr:FtsQ-type POTRA domain-containing protein [Candidatus Neomarinimicrobiota bacterium]